MKRHLVIDLDEGDGLIQVLSALLTHHPDEPCPCQTEGYDGKDVHDHIVSRSPVASVRIRGMGLDLDLVPDGGSDSDAPKGDEVKRLKSVILSAALSQYRHQVDEILDAEVESWKRGNSIER